MAKNQQLFDWLRLDKQSEIALFRQIYLLIRSAIVAKNILPNSILPSTRKLAGELKVSRNTVINAYELLVSEG